MFNRLSSDFERGFEYSPMDSLMVVVVVVADRGDLGNVVMSSSYERKRGKNEKNNRDEIGTFSCSGLSIISAIPEPGESERLGFG